jgi:hypothetical protein
MWGLENAYAPTRCVGHIYPRPAAYVNAKRKPNQRTRTISTKGDSSTCKCGLGARLCWFCTERAQNTYLNNQYRALPYSGLVAQMSRQEEQGAGEGGGRRGRSGIGVGARYLYVVVLLDLALMTSNFSLLLPNHGSFYPANQTLQADFQDPTAVRPAELLPAEATQ